jgi:hypothetical protein
VPRLWGHERVGRDCGCWSCRDRYEPGQRRMTDTDTDTYKPLTERGRENVQAIIDLLTETGDAIGGFTDKVNARQTGVSIYLTFDNKVDVMRSVKFADQLVRTPAFLVDACAKLLAADARIAELEAPQSGR